jgi:hypothetical protein
MRLPVLVVPTTAICAECGFVLYQSSPPNIIHGTAIFECKTRRCKRFEQSFELPLQKIYCKRVG